jgi:hypothetical protein
MYKRINSDEIQLNTNIIIIGKVKNINEQEINLDMINENGRKRTIKILADLYSQGLKTGQICEFWGEFITEDVFNMDDYTIFNDNFNLNLYDATVKKYKEIMSN